MKQLALPNQCWNYNCTLLWIFVNVLAIKDCDWHAMSHTTRVAVSPPSLQLNQTQSSVAGLVEVLSGRRRLWALGEVAASESGYTQALELKHSYPQVFMSYLFTDLKNCTVNL